MNDSDSDRDRDTEDGAVRGAADAGVDRDSDADADPEAGSTIGTQLDEGLRFERAPIEPERPNPENTLFVVLGALGTVGLLASVFAPGLI